MVNEMQRLAYILALLKIPGIGSATLTKILAAYPQPDRFFQESTAALQAAGFSAVQIQALKKPDWEAVDAALNWSSQAGQQILFIEDANYPRQLKEIANPPAILYARGNSALLCSLQIAVVGSRNPSPNGLSQANYFAYELARNGFSISSGLAIGIDGASHRGALQAGGHTVAVLGTGLNHIYPKCHRKLAEEIAEKGVIVSEFPLNTQALPENFPRRNRIISGLAQGVLVVEAAMQSGSLITARLANEQGREVFALPHAIHHPKGKGCHYLIKQGAKLVESVEDILEEIAPPLAFAGNGQNFRNSPLPLAKDARKLVECITCGPVPLEHIITCTGLSTEKVLSLILELELENIIQKIPGGYQLNERFGSHDER